MKKFEIESPVDIYNFLNFIYLRCLCTFDPAENLAELKDVSGRTVFTPEELVAYEKTMNNAFLYCVFNKINIYGFSEFVEDHDHFKTAA